MATGKLIKDTIYYGLVPKLTIFVTIFTTPLITPFLMPYDYGISGVVSSYTSFISSLAPLGLHVHLTNSFFENPRHYNLVWGRILFLVLLSSFVLCILVIGRYFSNFFEYFCAISDLLKFFDNFFVND